MIEPLLIVPLMMAPLAIEALLIDLLTSAPLLIAPLDKDKAHPAGSIVPSPGLYKVPYKSSMFINGYKSFVSLGDNTCELIPYTLPIYT